MREIKFKGKKNNNSEWIFGDLVHYDDKIYITPCKYSSKPIEYFEVIPETISQFTGLKDKNGVEIYEGDIVEHDVQSYYLDISDWELIKGEVVFINGLWCVCSECHPLWGFNNEVIGNIHDKN